MEIFLPFSKSEINRVFVLAFQSPREFLIRNFSFCDDTRVVYDFFNDTGVYLNFINFDLQIHSKNIHFASPHIVNVHQAGTAFRFLLALCSVLPYSFQFIGHESLAKRPIFPLTNLLSKIGVTFHFHQQNLSLPLSFHGIKSFNGSELSFDDEVLSSQYISALLLLAPSLPLHFVFKIKNPSIASQSYILMTIQMLEKLGIIWDYDDENLTFQLIKNTFDIFEYTISADWTNASYFIALSAILKKPIKFPNLNIHSFQPDVNQLFNWMELGVNFSTDAHYLIVDPHNFELIPFEWDFSSTPDLFQTFAVLTAYKKGTYNFLGLETLKHKETHRLFAMSTELAKLGISVQYDENMGTCTISNNVDNFPSKVDFNTYNDHRMAMALSLLKPLIPDLSFDNENVVNKSFPDFWGQYKRLLDGF